MAEINVVPYIDVMLVLLQKAGVTKVGLMSDPMELGLGPEGETE
jgi:biopolymer transport protein ExbD